MLKVCQEHGKKAEMARKDLILEKEKNKMKQGSLSAYIDASKQFQLIPGWKDADDLLQICKQQIDEITAREKAELERKKELAREEAARIAARNKKIGIIVGTVACVALVFIILLNTVIIPSTKYNHALKLMNAGQYEEAIVAFEAMDGYRDSVNKIEECNVGIYGKEAWNKIKSVNVGDIYNFGMYEQDNNNSNGQENIEWLVLAKEGTKILVVSKYALDCKPYNTSYLDVTWEACTLRKWLNNDFINTAFSATEQAMIPTVTVSADKNPEYNTNPGNATQDKVFLLSITEANKYFSSDSARACQPTAYAVANGAYKSGNGNCWWWVRSPGYFQSRAAGVDYGGGVGEGGYAVDRSSDAVRPALWINLNS